MVELTLLPCPRCGGDGYDLHLGGDSYALFGSDLPSEAALPCPHCDGSGEVEVCAGCLEPLEVRGGREVCGCAAPWLRRAA